MPRGGRNSVTWVITVAPRICTGKKLESGVEQGIKSRHSDAGHRRLNYQAELPSHRSQCLECLSDSRFQKLKTVRMPLKHNQESNNKGSDDDGSLLLTIQYT